MRVGGPGLVEEGLDPSESGEVVGDTEGVDHGEDAAKGGSGGTGSSDGEGDSISVDDEVGSDGGDIREGTTGGVEEGSRRELSLREEAVDSSGLVRGLGKVVGETTRGKVHSDLSLGGGGRGSSRDDVGATRGEVRSEDVAVILVLASNTPITFFSMMLISD